MEVTRDLYNLNLFTKLRMLHCQILFSLATAAIAEAILMQTSAEQVPSLHRVAPRYLKLVTSCSFWPFMLISALMLCMLLGMISLFFCAGFHSTCQYSVYELVLEVFKFKYIQ